MSAGVVSCVISACAEGSFASRDMQATPVAMHTEAIIISIFFFIRLYV